MAKRELVISFDVRVGTILCTIREKGKVETLAETFGESKEKALAKAVNVAHLSPIFSEGTGVVYTPGKGRTKEEYVKLSFGRTTGLQRD